MSPAPFIHYRPPTMKLLFAILIAAVLVGCATPAHRPATTPPTRFVAELNSNQVVRGNPAAHSNAHGKATLILSGNRLMVHGAFSGLISPLRDIDQTPGNPGVYIHSGNRGREGSQQFGLPVELNLDERSGTFSGEFQLSPGQLSQLRNGTLYLAVHTDRFEAGEIRGQIEADPRFAR